MTDGSPRLYLSKSLCIRGNLPAYCKFDTPGMVRIYERLRRISDGR